LSPVAAGNQVLLLTPASVSLRELGAVRPEATHVRVGSIASLSGRPLMAPEAVVRTKSAFDPKRV